MDQPYKASNNSKEPQDPRDAILAHLEQQAQLALKDLRARQGPQVPLDPAEVRLVQLEQQAHRDRQALSELLVRLEHVLASARQFWYHKTTLLKWMITILVLIVLDRLLSHFPTILQIVQKLS
jgi:hypothetical protein